MAHVGLNLERAEAVVRQHLRPTPLVRSSALGVSLKLECLQQTGAYKVRGALHALHRQVASGDLRTVVAASAGNHAAGVAWAARAVGLRAVTVVPMDAPLSKIRRTEALGATVVRRGATFAEAKRHALELARRDDARFLHAYDDWDIIQGQATVGMELRAHRPDVVLVPVGGGGLASGVCLAFAGTDTQVVGVRVGMEQRMASIADGTRVATLGQRTEAVLREHLAGWVTVTDGEVREAMRRLYVTEGWVEEGAGALAVAAASRVSGAKVVAVVSGGNVDAATFRGVIGAAAPGPSRGWSARPSASVA